MIKLIASDMDGTLLDAHMSVSPENAEAIRFANDAGVEFMVATGRNYQEARAALDGRNRLCDDHFERGTGI